ncbi:hypothetical protein BDQ17DRAFT_1391962 [Cyathus striatus]|nr:hypothetical protein BDQ17DRAFT_1391962 [Cyathus striatus]
MSFTPNESSQALFIECTWLQGAILSSVAYGMVFTLFILCFNLLLYSARTSKERKFAALLIYICVIFALGTLFMCSLSAITQKSFIDDRDYPGGPGAYESDMYGIPISELGNACYTIANWCADTLLVWRCYIIYRGSRIPVWLYMMLPCMLLTISYVMGILYLIQVGAPLGSPWSNNPINYTLLYASISLTLNMFITVMIVVRLLVYRRRLLNTLGGEHGTVYLSVTTILIESAALYAMFSLMFLIPFGLKSAFANIMLQALSEIQIVASLLIIYRVAQGKAWNHDTASNLMTLQQMQDDMSSEVPPALQAWK